jgi:glycine cleavage system H lipoate-binding protein
MNAKLIEEFLAKSNNLAGVSYNGVELPADRLYDSNGFWYKASEDNTTINVGLSPVTGTQVNGYIEFIEVYVDGHELATGDCALTVELAEDNLEFIVPFRCTVYDPKDLEVMDYEDQNNDPNGEGWLVNIDVADFDPSTLLTAQGLAKRLGI